jgi:hypothetical protein
MTFAFDLEPRDFYSFAMLDPPTDRRLYKIAHSRRAETSNLRHPMLTISFFFDVLGAHISDNMRAALAITSLFGPRRRRLGSAWRNLFDLRTFECPQREHVHEVPAED